ncbi:MAG: DEAD/DEAH box helicase, partial [Bacteroidota bacterium]
MFNEKYNKRLAAAFKLNGFETPKELQSKAITKINGGFDIIGVGPINSGRTTLIVMSVIQKLQRAFEDAPRALILVSDMEKALAMKEKFMLLAKDTDLRIYSVS